MKAKVQNSRKDDKSSNLFVSLWFIFWGEDLDD